MDKKDIASAERLLKLIQGNPPPDRQSPADDMLSEANTETEPDKSQRTDALKKLTEISEVIKDHKRPAEPDAEPRTSQTVRPLSAIPPSEAQPHQPQHWQYKVPQMDVQPPERTYVGLDIGSYAVKMVEVSRQRDNFNLLSCAIIEIGEHTKSLSQAEYVKAVTDGIRRALSVTNPTKRQAIYTAVGGPAVTVRQVSMPHLSPKELESSIQWEAKKYIPPSSSDLEIDFQILDSDPHNPKMNVLLVAVPKDIIERHLNILQSIQIKPAATDINPFALMGALTANNGHLPDETVVIMDIGAETATITVYREAGECFVRSLPVSGHQLTQEIQQQLDIDPMQAESLKRQRNNIIPLIEPALHKMIMEIRKTLTFYHQQFKIRGYDRFFISGGSAGLNGLTDYLQQELGIEVNIFNPLGIFNIGAASPLAVKEVIPFAPQLTIATGLAIREE